MAGVVSDLVALSGKEAADTAAISKSGEKNAVTVGHRRHTVGTHADAVATDI